MGMMIILAGIIFQKIFICVVVANYLKANETASGVKNSNAIEKGYLDMTKYIIKKKIKKNIKISTEMSNSIIYKIVSNFLFDSIIYVIVLGNIMLMGFDTDPISDENYNMITYINYFCLGVYNLEIMLKLMAFGTSIYFADGYNGLDCFTITLIDMFTVIKIVFGLKTFANFFIVFRISVVGKIMTKFTYLDSKISKNLKVIFDAMNFLMLSLGAIVILMFLFISIYSIIGMHLFYNIPHQYMVPFYSINNHRLTNT